MERFYMLDDDNTPYHEPDILKWSEWYADIDRRIVQQDKVGDALISTVFLGLDHQLSPDGPPILYETMIFGGPHDLYQERYETRDQAQAGHHRALELIR